MSDLAAAAEVLFARWVERYEIEGVAPEPEVLCRDRPELLEPLQQYIRNYERVGRALNPPTVLEPGQNLKGSPPEGLALGRRLLHFRILDKLGEGGMGQVYAAEDSKLGRRVALKVLPPEMADDPERLRRFRREAKTLAALSHPNIVSIFSVEEVDGVHFLTMELVVGKTLDAFILPGGMERGRILEFAEPLVDALVAAHERGIIHRDLKPANLMVSAEGRLKILDFGLAKLQRAELLAEASLAATETLLTQAGRVLGTVAYMSPEQARGEKVDERTDLFSLGVVLYEMATGRLAFAGKSPAEIFKRILADTAPPPSELNPKIPAELERLILELLEKDRGLRCQSASEALASLKRLKRDTTLAVPAGSGAVASASVTAAPSSRRGLWAGLGAVAALAVAFTAFWPGGGGRAPDPLAAVAPEARPAMTAAPDTPSVAVLPFADMSPDKDQEYFTDGLAEELLNVLARLEGLRVAARTSSFSFKGRHVKVGEIARELNVSNILEGSVRKAGNQLRITAQLVNAADGFHLWSDTYDRQLDDIFAVQDDIARSVAEALKVELLGGETAPASGATSAEAYNAYLQGRYFEGRFNEEDVRRAIGYYEEALALDDSYAPAWAGLSSAYLILMGFSTLPLDEGVTKARQAAERALELDDTLAAAHMARGLIQKDYDWDWAGAAASMERALELEPNNASIVLRAATSKANRGYFDEELSRRAIELDPLNSGLRFRYGVMAWRAGRLDEAAAAIEKSLELTPGRAAAHVMLGRVYLAQSRPEEALREMEREPEAIWRVFGLALTYHALARRNEADEKLARLIEVGTDEAAFQVAQVYAFRGEVDKAFEWLERAYAQRDPGLAHIRGSVLANLHDDPRWPAFLEKMGLAG